VVRGESKESIAPKSCHLEALDCCCQLLDLRCLPLDILLKPRVQYTGFGVQVLVFSVQRLVCSVQCPVFRVQGVRDEHLRISLPPASRRKRAHEQTTRKTSIGGSRGSKTNALMRLIEAHVHTNLDEIE
jgi:hypothetical protein